MKIEFFKEFIPPKTTVQQRRQNKFGGYLHDTGKIARATWKAIVEPYRPETPMCGAIALSIAITWPHTKRSRTESGKRNTPVVAKTTRPDSDNIVKMILDVMQETGFFHDDSQIFDMHISRYYGDIAGVFISICNEEKAQ